MIKAQWFRGLSVQLAALLTLALFPLGSIALFQTNRVAAEADQNAGLALLGLTERAARDEQVLIERAVGAARLFGSIAPDLLQNPASCTPILSRFVDASAEFSFIGVLPPSGIVDCSSSPLQLDFRDTPDFARTMAAQEATITVNRNVPASGQSVFVISEPFRVDGAFAGFVSVSIPHSGLPQTTDRLEDLGLENLITFNDAGEVLTSRAGFTQLAELPAGRDLAGLVGDEPQTFRARNRDGQERRYSVVTIEGSPASVMAVWRVEDGAGRLSALTVAPALFPALMWFASMGVAMLAVHTLVLRHLRRLRRRMDRFADDRQTDDSPSDKTFMPYEIEKLEQNFQQMSAEIMQDEAGLENALREKGVLVKEIHHRVKNNLQLIASIMNMQIRAAEHPETKTVLRRVQDRVLSLATIHRDLYQSQDGGLVDVGALVTEIVENSVELIADENRALNVVTDIDPVRLYPDQAVPLSLLVAEAATNAMKFIGTDVPDGPAFSVSFKRRDRNCVLVMTNVIGRSQPQDSTGLGSQLINAFTMQLGGQIDTTQTEDRYTLTLSFDALEFEPEARDY